MGISIGSPSETSHHQLTCSELSAVDSSSDSSGDAGKITRIVNWSSGSEEGEHSDKEFDGETHVEIDLMVRKGK